MKRIYILLFCFTMCLLIVPEVQAENVFPEFDLSLKRLYIPIDKLPIPFEDLEHEVGLNFSYSLNCQLFIDPLQGHIQTLSEGFSGKSDKSTPWKTLTELLAAYHQTDIEAAISLFTPNSQGYIRGKLSTPDIKSGYIEFMKALAGIEVLMGFGFKDGFLAMTNLIYNDASSEPARFYFVKSNEQYFLSTITLRTEEDPMYANIAVFLRSYPVKDLTAPTHALSVEKQGTGDGNVRGSGLDCGDDCQEVFVEGTAAWLKADGDEYSTFEGWLLNGEPLIDRLVIKEDTTVTAVFEKIPPKEYTLAVEKSGSGDGIVMDSDAVCETAECLKFFTLYADEEEAPIVESGIDCDETCSVTYLEGTTVYLEAVAAEGSEFVEWQVNGEAITTLPEITEDLVVKAVFDTITPPEEQPEEPQPEETQP